MNADQSNRDYRERMKTNPVSICLKPFLATGLIKALVTGILLCVQAFPVNAASGIHKEITMENMANGIIHSKVPGDVDSVWNKLLLTLENMKGPCFFKSRSQSQCRFSGAGHESGTSRFFRQSGRRNLSDAGKS